MHSPRGQPLDDFPDVGSLEIQFNQVVRANRDAFFRAGHSGQRRVVLVGQPVVGKRLVFVSQRVVGLLGAARSRPAQQEAQHEKTQEQACPFPDPSHSHLTYPHRFPHSSQLGEHIPILCSPPSFLRKQESSPLPPRSS